MSVGNLCGIAKRLGRDGLNTHLVNLSRRGRREDYAISQLFKEGSPERIVLVHVKNLGNTYCSALCLGFGKRLVIKESLHFVFVEIGNVSGVSLSADSAFASVTGDKLSSAGELVDSKAAGVGTSAAFSHACFVLKTDNIV